MKITTHLLTKNDSGTIETALKSLLPLNGEIIIGDLGSDDDTVKICRGYGAKVISFAPPSDFSKVRNELIHANGSSWQLYLEPWEALAGGHEIILGLSNPEIYSIQVLQGDIITKECRLWNKATQLKFIQPVYETLNNKVPEKFLPGVVVFSVTTKDNLQLKSDLVEKWLIDSPLANEPHYYHAFTLLGQKQYKEFTKAAEQYLFRETTGMPAILIQYYLALIQLYLGNTQVAVRGAVSCITAKPLMSEFWCLLGDIYYKIKKYQKAILYYENAMILGRKRLQSDQWPIEISKYKKYPTKMIESCKSIISNTKLYGKL